MKDVEKLREERTQIFSDVFDNKIPKRVPIDVSLSLTVVADYGNIDRKAAYWDPTLLQEAAEKLCELIPSDSCVYGGTVYTPSSSQTLDSINKVMSDTGFMQHPNTQCMYEDEYDELIEDPYAFIIDKCLPRIYRALDPEVNPGRAMFALAQDVTMGQLYFQKAASLTGKLYEKFGYPVRPRGTFGRAPMDWIADQLRSFTGICIDVRRNREKLLKALDAIYPMMYKIGLPDNLENINRQAVTMFQLHMATYLREKDFAEIWLPSWKRLVTDYAALGMRCGAFLEHDWTRLLDYVYDLPTGMYFTFEYTDPKKLKEKLGQKFVLGRGFPIKYLTSCTKDEVIDKTKEWLDIMAPGGQYIFGFDKDPVSLSDINLENLIAVCETVLEYGVYDNPGTPTGEIFNKEDYKHSEVPEFESKYYLKWEDYLKKYPNTPENAKELVFKVEDQIFARLFLMSC